MAVLETDLSVSPSIATYHHADWAVGELVAAKGDARIVVCIPARDEVRTIGAIVSSICDHLRALWARRRDPRRRRRLERRHRRRGPPPRRHARERTGARQGTGHGGREGPPGRLCRLLGRGRRELRRPLRHRPPRSPALRLRSTHGEGFLYPSLSASTQPRVGA